MEFTYAHSPRWATESHSSIDLVVNFVGIGEVQFSASPDDCEDHGKEIYAKAVAGEFGSIAPYQAPEKTPEQIQVELTDAIQAHLDQTAKIRGYDGILSLCTYATSTNPVFAAEGQAGVVWRDLAWDHGWAVLADVKSGSRSIPTAEELISEMPKIEWPN